MGSINEIKNRSINCIGNIYSARTKEEFPEWDAVAMIGKMIRNILLRLLGDKE
jgi:hypothetical protein